MSSTPDRSELHDDNATSEVVDPGLGVERSSLSSSTHRFPLGSRRLLRALPYVALVAAFMAPPVVGALVSGQSEPEPSPTPQEPSEIIYHRDFSYDRTRSGTPGVVGTPKASSLGSGLPGGELGGSLGGNTRSFNSGDLAPKAFHP